ncbi:coiled-coil domain-containing protein 57 [Alosa sapidissima]|uniref:coiled-coil domain-containing protein 57 n=1 Tax=Alosa sapidissima TaxID=34773 RepID=UPI001C09D9C4|nr:coiled-coil domain-containing protein 57 [Alosa sapidissima]
MCGSFNINTTCHSVEMLNSEDFESTLVKKEREWKELQALHTRQLEFALKEATTELYAQRKHFQGLMEDFQFNLKLLEERDHKLQCYDAIITKFQVNDCTRQEEVSELRVQIGKLQETRMQEKRQCSELYTRHQEEMADLQLHLNTVCSEKNEEIQRLEEENEGLKNSLRLKVQQTEGELALQKTEMMAYFDVEMRKQEHEFNLRIDDLCNEVLSHKLKVELLNKELEVHTRTQSQATQALQASEDQCYQAHKEIQHKDWVLKSIISMKDTRIQELEDQLSQMEHKHEKEEEKACRMYAELEAHARDRETVLTHMSDVHAEQLCEAETRRRELQTQLDVLLAEQTMRDRSHTKELQQRDQEILRLRSELEATRSSWDTYITQVSKDMVIKDTELLTIREQETKLREELNRCNEDVKRYKQQLTNGLKHEQTLEQKLVQLELDWKRRCEDVRAEDCIRDKELVESLTFSRDKAMAALFDKDKELKEMKVLLNTFTTEKEQTLEGKHHGLPNKQTPELGHATSEIYKLQKQNASLRAVVAEMRKEMENLTRELSPTPTVSHTENKKMQYCPTDRTEDTHTMEEEMKELKARCLYIDGCLEEGSTTAIPTLNPTASEKLVSHIRSLRSTINRLQMEKGSNLAALKEKQVRIAVLETAVGHFLQKSHSTQTENEELLQELFSKKRWSVTIEDEEKDSQKSGQDVSKDLIIKDSTLPEKLRQAVWWMSRLSREKQQLIELGNCLRAQLTEAGLEELVPTTKGQRLDHSHLSTLELLQYQLTSQELQYAQLDHSNKSLPIMKPAVSNSQHEDKYQPSQTNQWTQDIVCRKDTTPTLSSAFKSSTIPSSPWISSVDTDCSLQDVWQILEKGLSPTVLTPTGSTDQVLPVFKPQLKEGCEEKSESITITVFPRIQYNTSDQEGKKQAGMMHKVKTTRAPGKRVEIRHYNIKD